MGVQPVPLPRLLLERLFTPGIRLGWAFCDRRALAAPYPESEPDAGHVQKAGSRTGSGSTARVRRQ